MQETKQISHYRQQLKHRIVSTALQMFADHGIKAVKMDDIATALAISKRTLYEIYDNKEVLLYESIKSYHLQTSEQIETFAATAADVMDVILYVYSRKMQQIRRTTPVLYTDLEKYPRVLEYLRGERQKKHDETIRFMLRGVSEGFFRPEVNYELTLRMMEGLGSYLRDNRLYQQYSYEEILRSLLFITLRGICTQKGIDRLDAYLK